MYNEGCKNIVKYGENKMANNAKKKKKKTLPIATYRQGNSMFKLTKNIGTGTLDYWLWIMDQELRAPFGQ